MPQSHQQVRDYLLEGLPWGCQRPSHPGHRSEYLDSDMGASRVAHCQAVGRSRLRTPWKLRQCLSTSLCGSEGLIAVSAMSLSCRPYFFGSGEGA